MLHLAPHLGGGVGGVLLNYLEAGRGGEIEHRLALLDYANEGARVRCAASSIPLADCLGQRPEELRQMLADADGVVMHWWNHPLLYQCLTSDWPETRLLLWSHVSGRAAPQLITEDLAAFPDLFAAASPVSLSLAALARVTENRVRLLFSTAGVGHLKGPARRPHTGFRAGYLGTVDYAKMHPDFIDLCLAAGLSDAVFPVAGGPEHETLRRELERRGVSDRFEILGPVPDPAVFLASLDILAYPLNPDHYGTGEQALIEAQAMGVPPVVLAGGAEEYVVEDEVTGLVAHSAAHFARQIKRLHDDPELRARLSTQAKSAAEARFGLEKFTAAFNELIEELLLLPKTPRRWPNLSAPPTPWQLFLISQGKAAIIFEETLAKGRTAQSFPPAFLSKSRGTVFHYAAFFPNDSQLGRAVALANGVRARTWGRQQ